jgi:predicted metal-dependent phosphoesterase TrpH
MLVELHSHTNHSLQKKIIFDGTCSPKAMVSHAKHIGLGAIAITDHDIFSGALEAKKLGKRLDILVIPGEEISTKDGHCLALGLSDIIPPDRTIEETIDFIHQQGAIAISSHPFDIKSDGLGTKARLCDAMEVFNALNVDRLTNNAARNFAKKHGLIGTAGSDAHHTSMLGKGLITTEANDVDGIIKNIRKSRFSLQVKYPDIDTIMRYALLRLKLSHEYTSGYIEGNYSFPKKQLAQKLLSVAVRSPGKVDYVFRAMAYASFASIVTYSAMMRAAKIISDK